MTHPCPRTICQYGVKRTRTSVKPGRRTASVEGLRARASSAAPTPSVRPAVPSDLVDRPVVVAMDRAQVRQPAADERALGTARRIERDVGQGDVAHALATEPATVALGRQRLDRGRAEDRVVLRVELGDPAGAFQRTRLAAEATDVPVQPRERRPRSRTRPPARRVEEAARQGREVRAPGPTGPRPPWTSRATGAHHCQTQQRRDGGETSAGARACDAGHAAPRRLQLSGPANGDAPRRLTLLPIGVAGSATSRRRRGATTDSARLRRPRAAEPRRRAAAEPSRRAAGPAATPSTTARVAASGSVLGGPQSGGGERPASATSLSRRRPAVARDGRRRHDGRTERAADRPAAMAPTACDGRAAAPIT